MVLLRYLTLTKHVNYGAIFAEDGEGVEYMHEYFIIVKTVVVHVEGHFLSFFLCLFVNRDRVAHDSLIGGLVYVTQVILEVHLISFQK
jgi:hypothetical protein